MDFSVIIFWYVFDVYDVYDVYDIYDIYDFKLQDDIIKSVFLVGGREVQLWTCEAEEAFLETDVHELHWEVNRLSILSSPQES